VESGSNNKMNFKQRIRRKLVSKLDKLRNFIENENNSNIITNGEANFLRIFKNFFKNEKITVVDVGSASGDYHSLISGADVFAFDGRQNFLVSDINGSRKFYIRDRAPELSSVNRLSYLDDKYGPVTEKEIPTKRLDALIKEYQIKHISLLKIDVEGHELHVINGLGHYLRSDFIDFIQFERGNAEADCRLKDLYSLFESKGFSIYKIYKRSIEKIPYTSSNENLNYANYVAVSDNINFQPR
jgi:hypothetical protein